MKLSRALALLVCSYAYAQNYALAPVARQQFLDVNGKPLAGGLLWTYAAGTSTPQATYSSSSGVANTNPVVLDSGGFASVWLGNLAYRLVLQNSAGVQQWAIDNVSDLGLLAKQQASVFSGWFVDVTAAAYGAVHDGVTDDTAHIQAAISAAASSGGTVYLPCGTYLLAQTNGIKISSPNVSLRGAAEACVVLHHTGSGAAVTIQMSPFSIQTAGEYGNFQILGSSSGAAGLVTGCIVGGRFTHLGVDGYTNGTGIDVQDRLDCATSSGGGWTERNTFDTVWGGGLTVGGGAYNKWGWKFETVGSPSNISFGYNRFLNVAANAHSGQIGFEFASGYLYNSTLLTTCNLNDGSSYTTPPVCMQVDGMNVAQNWYQVTGEYGGTHSAKSVNVVSGAFWGYGSMVVFDQSGNPIAGSSTATVQQANSRVTALAPNGTWDTGAMTINSTATTPAIIASDNQGITNFGYSVGTNIASPWISMFSASGNHFMVCQLNSGTSVANCPVGANRLFDIASSTGVVSVPGGGNFFTYGASLAPLQVGGMTASGTTAGYQNAALTPLSSGTGTGQLNESLAVGLGGQAGLGDSEGTNVSHPILFGYSGDGVDLEFYEKGFRVPITGTPVFRITHGGNVEPGQHLTQPSSGHDIAGTCALSASTVCSVTFTHAFASAPLCVATPAFNPGGASYWISSAATTACQVTFSANQTGNVTIYAVGNPN